MSGIVSNLKVKNQKDNSFDYIVTKGINLCLYLLKFNKG